MRGYDDWREVDELDDFANAYRSWLNRTMHGEDHRILFDILYETEFTWSSKTPRDEDRALDGIYLRRRFSESSGMREPLAMRGVPCSFLEMVVALAYSIEDRIMYDPSTQDDASTWFWIMMDNADLSYHTDQEMMEGSSLSHAMVIERVSAILARRYASNGEGGLFPLSEPQEDQRKAEIWTQCNAYFMENFV